MKLKKFTAALLGATMLCSSTAFAAELDTKAKTEDLNYLYETLKSVHPDIFYNNTEERFLEKKAEIEQGLDGTSDLEFVIDLQSLVSLVGDSHTKISIGADKAHLFPVNMAEYDGKWTLVLAPEEYRECLGMEIDTIAGLPIDELCQRFSALFSSDNSDNLKYQFSKNFYVQEFLEYLNVIKDGEPLKLTVHNENGDKIELTVNPFAYEDINSVKFAKITDLVKGAPATEYDGDKYYFAKPLNETAYYIQYNRCMEDPTSPIADFEKQVYTDLNSGSYTQILIDLRNNGGGSDGVIQPTLKIIKDYADKNNATVYGLIGQRTFSSAIINSVMIKEMGGYLVGVPTSGSVNHFGEVGSFNLPNSGIRVSYSNKMIWLGDYLDAAQGYGIESLKPDLTVYESLEDYLNGIDTVVEAVLKNPEIHEYSSGKPLYLTRGGLVTYLYEIAAEAGKGGYEGVSDFYDVFPFAENYDAVCWAEKNNIISGVSDEEFGPSKLVTREAAAVIIDRFMDFMEADLQAGNAELSDSDKISGWAEQSVNKVVSAGIIETQNGAFNPSGNISEEDGSLLAQRVKDLINA